MFKTQEYNSVAETRNSRKSRKRKSISPDLAAATFQALQPFIDIHDCGHKWNGDPLHMITKEERRLMERYRHELRCGVENPCIYYESKPWRQFLPKDYFSGELAERHIRQMIAGTETYYYTSGRAKRALLYLDLDAHKEHQTLADSKKAVEVWHDILGGTEFHRPSQRGDNVFIKIDYRGYSPKSVNDVFKRFEEIGRRYLECRGANVDFEVKGNITIGDKSGLLAKLPVGNYQGSPWTWELLEEFKAKPIIGLGVLITFLDRVEAIMDGETVAEITEMDNTEKGPRRTSPPAESVGFANRLASEGEVVFRDEDTLAEQDARKRQHEALMHFCRQEGRVVSVEEAMEYIKVNGLYTPPWDNPARRRRVEGILKFIARTFDPDKCCGKAFQVKVGKFHNWAWRHVGNFRMADRRGVDEYGRVFSTPAYVRVEPRFASAALSAIEFCLATDPNEDGSIPEHRLEAIWPQDQVKWNAKKWRACRDMLDRMGVIRVTDRNWSVGKAMRYALGEGFDRLAQWWRRERKPSQVEAVKLEEFLGTMRRTKGHNSYRRVFGEENGDLGQFVGLLVRPPP